jgi:hypothetical protein
MYYVLHRVAAIFPEHFQSLTVALKNHIFPYYFAQTVLALCISGNKDKQTRSGKGKSIGSSESCDSLRASRRMDLKRDYKP